MYGEGAASASQSSVTEPAVTVAVSKRKGTNAIDIADSVLAKVESLKGTFIPADVRITTTRNYGETAPTNRTNCCFIC
jgi:multidrug efflux pump subunit AcrB